MNVWEYSLDDKQNSLYLLYHIEIIKKYLVDQSMDDKIVGEGFAYLNGQRKFNSWTFNTGTEYHKEEN